mmetsp:Transcript_11813/g.30666  ORF Transcript_11813/g.30666 Transcript_11813/m.30666 type:complete len:228 (-) Transcript_11813:2154-2837(-)
MRRARGGAGEGGGALRRRREPDRRRRAARARHAQGHRQGQQRHCGQDWGKVDQILLPDHQQVRPQARGVAPRPRRAGQVQRQGHPGQPGPGHEPLPAERGQRGRLFQVGRGVGPQDPDHGGGEGAGEGPRGPPRLPPRGGEAAGHLFRGQEPQLRGVRGLLPGHRGRHEDPRQDRRGLQGGQARVLPGGDAHGAHLLHHLPAQGLHRDQRDAPHGRSDDGGQRLLVL